MSTMSAREKRDSQRVPVALRIKLRFRKVDTFVSKFATNISTCGMFISSRKPKEPKTQLRFELCLADNSTLIAGRGEVMWTYPYDSAQPESPHGMGIRFIGLSSTSKELIARMVALRVQQGLGDEGIPFAPENKNAPAKHPRSAKQGAPETDANSFGTSFLDELEHDVDMVAALQRARTLVGTDETDVVLESLARVSAAPIAETVDVASHELAKLLGGSPILARPPVQEAISEESENEAPAASPAKTLQEELDEELAASLEEEESIAERSQEEPLYIALDESPATEPAMHLDDALALLSDDVEVDEDAPTPALEALPEVLPSEVYEHTVLDAGPGPLDDVETEEIEVIEDIDVIEEFAEEDSY